MMDLIAPRILCVGTHHKTGTLWMRAVFRALADRLGVGLHVVFPASGEKLIPAADRVFLVQWSSAFPQAVLDRPDARILHIVRDPRNVLLSGMRYHLSASEGGEEFLHSARADLDGTTYQQHLNALPDETARLIFEMDEKHAETLEAMLTWDYERPNTIEVRYEDLMTDTEGRAFREHLRNLGLPEPEVDLGVQLFWENALFGGLSDPVARPGRIKAHVTGTATRDWRSSLPREVARIYADRYGAALVRLGYESHPTRWVEEIRHAA
ncbi:Sulfotransferase domain-containing protein [Jannaschia faecimaris]|uniref:Sulfotransferase domain-containing protein n=1 Tax=Jannaschia faecimaris TaxID=1244108 RepID=A0A1H3SYK0_9RHOB|nr:sulfotransferase domain-containing protein [Jannaschia faecimaris]SDZ42651.1 Sulfotransferase domain-containing protein [Jannaschia faecimaris]